MVLQIGFFIKKKEKKMSKFTCQKFMNDERKLRNKTIYSTKISRSCTCLQSVLDQISDAMLKWL